MSKHVVKQPNGLYAIWSTVVDNFVVFNADRAELIEYRQAEARAEIVEEVDAAIAAADRALKPRRWVTDPPTYADSIETIQEVHGEASATEQHEQMSRTPEETDK